MPNDSWLTGLRGVQRKILADQASLLIGEGTAGADFVRHVAIRLTIPFEMISPPLDLPDESVGIPVRDRIVIESADIIYVLALRANGNLHQLLRRRLQNDGTNDRVSDHDQVHFLQHTQSGQQIPGAPVILVDLPGLQPKSARNELCDLGARLWRPTAEQCCPLARISLDPRPIESAAIPDRDDVYLIIPFPSREGWDFLTHSTRSCPGPWPDETFEAYMNSLLECADVADHSALGALRRILSQRRLIASGRTIREGHPVVSFTSRPLESLPMLRQFRPHRTHWDFEPYGLCIRREWLIRRGVRPVRYGNEASWQSLENADRPFFQLASGDSGIDWSIEEESRHLGDLDLSELTEKDVIVIVPNFEAAKSIRQITSWPITLWPGSNSGPDETA